MFFLIFKVWLIKSATLQGSVYNRYSTNGRKTIIIINNNFYCSNILLSSFIYKVSLFEVFFFTSVAPAIPLFDKCCTLKRYQTPCKVMKIKWRRPTLSLSSGTLNVLISPLSLHVLKYLNLKREENQFYTVAVQQKSESYFPGHRLHFLASLAVGCGHVIH